MTLPSKPVVIRLPAEMAQKFDHLQTEFAGLQPAMILRMLIADQLSKPIHEQIEVVTNQIRKPAKALKKPGRQSFSTNRIEPQ